MKTPTRPTKRQKGRAIAIIRKDCAIADKYCKDGKTCAIGALALAAGVTAMALMRYDERLDSCIDTIPNLAKRLQVAFGFDIYQLIEIQRLNDRFTTPSKRRMKIIPYIKSL